MELFSEIHSRYFFIISEILKATSQRKLSRDDIVLIAAQLGFAETTLALTPALLNVADDSYCLLQESSAGFQSILKNPPPFLITQLQKSWLKAITNDTRFSLFVEEHEHALLNELLSDIDPLYAVDHFIAAGMANDGDHYEDRHYRKIFKTLLQAIQEKKIIKVTYESGKGNLLTASFAPYKLEYSLKDDKFRLTAVRMHQERMRSLYKLNLARIADVRILEYTAPGSLAAAIKKMRMPMPVEIEISNERNGFERIFMQLSNFERVSEFDVTSKKCLMKIYYYEVDETELLITLLSFGPVIRVIGPESFKKQFSARILRQVQLVTGANAPAD